jgi:hypothetical protein
MKRKVDHNQNDMDENDEKRSRCITSEALNWPLIGCFKNIIIRIVGFGDKVKKGLRPSFCKTLYISY